MDPDANVWGATQTHVRRFNITFPSCLDWRDMGFVSKVSCKFILIETFANGKQLLKAEVDLTPDTCFSK